LARLIAQLERLPGVGPKSAQRLAFHMLRQSAEDVKSLADAIQEAKAKIGLCTACQSFTEADVCEICTDPRRTTAQICIVAEPKDTAAIERLHEYKGKYHVLHGLLSPMDGVGPEQLRVKELLARLEQGGVEEIILATNPTIEGDATALYLASLLKPIGIKVTRLAHGMPSGGELDYADTATLLSAFEYRREV
jgi:recombination protein RecR